VTIQVDPDSTGKIVDTATVAGNERVIEVIGDPVVAAAVARVLNGAPAAGDYGLVVRVASPTGLTDAQLRASAVPVSGTFFQATQPVSGTFWQATQPISAAALPLPAGASTEATLALIKAKTDNLDVLLSTRTKPADVQAVSGTFFQATQPVSIAGTVAVSATQLPAALGQGTMAQGMKVTLASDQSTLPAVSEIRAATLHVTATGLVNAAVTLTLPAAAAGLFHYITSIQITKLYAVVGVAAGAGVIITSTNLPGNPAWTTEQLASVAGTAVKVVDYQPTTPLKASVAATNTTIVCPVQLQTIWRINVSYFTAV
jgi:hypothetical protein